MCVYIERYLVAYIYETGYHVFGDFVWWKASKLSVVTHSRWPSDTLKLVYKSYL